MFICIYMNIQMFLFFIFSNTNVNNAEYFYLSHDLNPSNMIRRGIWSNNVDLVIKQPQHIWVNNFLYLISCIKLK